MKSLNEKLDFSLSIKDYENVTKLMSAYLEDRTEVYNSIFLNTEGVSEEDKTFYIHFFITPLLEGKEQHPYIDYITHFINRKYEFFTLPKVDTVIYELRKSFNVDSEDLEEIESFDEYEYESICSLYDLWNELGEMIDKYPILMLDHFKYKSDRGVQLYYEKDTDPSLLKMFENFTNTMLQNFPKLLRRIDTFFFVNPEYIELAAGEGVEAYYLEDAIYLRSKVPEKDKVFIEETIYHEFGHHLFALASESNQLYWKACYEEWEENGVKMTREENNEVEEVFADAMSYLYSPKNDFIKKPSEIILDTCREFIKQEFGVTEEDE